MFKMLNFM